MYSTRNHSKFYIKFHLIFVVKYRKRLLISNLDNDLKVIIENIANNSDFDIDVLETDIDHAHILVNSIPKLSPLQIVRKLKQETTIRLWKLYPKLLRKHFWKENTFWSNGYFICSTGDASAETIRKYIENQG